MGRGFTKRDFISGCGHIRTAVWNSEMHWVNKLTRHPGIPLGAPGKPKSNPQWDSWARRDVDFTYFCLC
jgi:hypothetical protein